MVYIRNKRVKGTQYAYLVKSVWDKEKKISKQETIKYLGRTNKISLSNIPVEFRNHPNVKKFIGREYTEKKQNYNKFVEKTQKELFQKLSGSGPIDYAKIYDDYKKDFTITEFYDKIIKQILYEVGDLWNTNQLPIGTEHVISNRLLSLLVNQRKHRKKTTAKKGKNKILICNPSGEQHNVACNMLESVLSDKGYNVFNMSPSTPSKDVHKYITDIQPDLVLVSITLPDNLQTGRKLVKRILDDRKTSVLVGGQAINEKNVHMFKPAEVIIQDTSLDNSLKEIKNMLRK